MSGIDVDELPENWEIKEWNDVLEIRSGKGYKNVENPEGAFPIIGSAGKTMGFADDYICEAGTTIVGRKGNINSPMFIEERFWNVDTAFGLHVFDNLFNRYLYYFCLSFNFTELDRGSGRPSLVKSDLKKVLIPVPPLEEQKQIVEILDEAFEAIEQAQANIEKNIENAQELFQSKLNDIFNQTGEGWEEKILGDVCRYDKTKFEGEDRPYVGLEHIESQTGVFLGELDNHSVKSSTFEFDSRHVLFGRLRPYLSKVLVPNFEGHCSTEIFPIITNDSVEREFIFYWFLAPKTLSKINATSTGARMPRANMNEVIKFELAIPDIPNQKKIVKKLNKLKENLEKVDFQYKQKLFNLEELKKSILEKAFAGELTKN